MSVKFIKIMWAGLLLAAFCIANTANADVVLQGGTGSSGAGNILLNVGTVVDTGHRAYFNGATTPASDWVWDAANSNGAGNPLEFTFSFSLSGFDVSTAQLTGLWGIDNVGSASLNGTLLSNLPNVVTGNFNVLHTLTAGPGSAAFVAGLNVLTFNVSNRGGPGAFRASVEVTANATTAIPIFSSADALLGGQLNGSSFEIGTIGSRSGANNWPRNEGPEHLIDGVGQKYLNFGEFNTGAIITPAVGCSIVDSIQFWTANDSEARDPASYKLYGTNEVIIGSSVALSLFTLISEGNLALPPSRNANGSSPLLDSNSQTIALTNSASYSSFLLLFPTVKNQQSANSMQLGEVQVFGTTCGVEEQGELLAHYQFEQTSWPTSDSVLDSSEHANHASPLGNVTPVLPADELVSCRVLDVPFNSTRNQLDGLDTKLDVDADIGNAGTISFWYRSDQAWGSGSSRQLFDASNQAPSQDKYFFLALDDTTLQFGLEDSNDKDLTLNVTGLNYAAGEWVHVAVAWDLINDTVQMYLNGSLAAATTNAGLNRIMGDMDTLYIGDSRSGYFVGESNDNSANGQYDDLRIYNFSQSQAQISEDLATVTECALSDEVFAFYQLEESTWSADGSILDSSGFHNHGSPVGDVAPVFPLDEQKSCQLIDVPRNTDSGVFDALDTAIDINELGNTGSISFWYRSNEAWNSGTARQLLDASTINAANSDPNKHFFLVLRNDGSLQFSLADENGLHLTATSDTAYNTSANTWVHVGISWDLPAQTMQIIVDSVSQAITYDNSAGLVEGIADFNTLYIGDNRSDYFVLDSSANSANGQFDDIRIYKFVQTVSEVATDAEALSPCDRSVLAFYQFEETSWPAAGTIVDSSGNGFDGSPVGAITPQFPSFDQKSCQVLDVPGNTSTSTIDALNTGMDVDSDIGDVGTISFWYRSNKNWSDSTARQLFDASEFISNNSDSKYFYLSLKSGSLIFGLEDSLDKDGSVKVSGLNYAANQWVHVAVTWNFAADEIAIHLNGAVAGINSNLGFNGETGDFSTLYVGDNRSSYLVVNMTRNSANGQFDDLRIYKFAQTQAEAKTDAETLTPCSGEPYAVYAFEESSWSGNSTVLDSSGNEHHGSPVGIVTPVLSSEQVSCRFVDIPGNTSVDIFDAIDTGVDINELGSVGTISFWYRSNNNWNSGTARQLFDASTTTSSDSNKDKYFYLALTTAGKLNFGLEDNNDRDLSLTTDSSYTFAGGVWVHLAVSWDLSSKTVLIYINGVSQSLSGSISSSLNSTLGDLDTLYLGDARSRYLVSQGTGNSADGQFDNLRLYTFGQSQSEIIADKENVTLCDALNHYRIEHDGQGFTCEAETLIIKACGNEECDTLYDQSTSVTLLPSGWIAGDTITFTGSSTTQLRYTTAEIITFAKTNATPSAPLRCFVGATETCDMDFVSDGFEFFGATTNDKTLPRQVAETHFENINIRAVRDEAGVCQAALAGTQTINFSYDCSDPDTCLTGLVGIPVSNPTGVNTGTLDLDFGTDGTASLSQLIYADAGLLSLSANAKLADDTVITSGEKSVLVIPAYLNLSSALSALDTYTAGVDFSAVLTAFGALGGELHNYQPGNIQLKLVRNTPDDVTAQEGQLRYDGSSSITTALDGAAVFTNVNNPALTSGIYSYLLNYAEVGSIILDVQDVDYFANQIDSPDSLQLGRFIPAYFEITENTPLLSDMCGNFSYIGQQIDFNVAPELTITAKNALGATTNNYGGTFWHYFPDINGGISINDSSSYVTTGTLSEFFTDSSADVVEQEIFNGRGTLTISDAKFSYNKVDGSNVAYQQVDPFQASVDFMFSAAFLTDDDAVCYQTSYPEVCNDFTIANIETGNASSTLRYGRIVFDNTYGPDTEALTVNIKTEYYQASQWLLNTDDNCTAIGFTETSGQLVVVDKTGSNIANLVDPVQAAGLGGLVLSQGQSNDNNDLFFNAPNTPGVLILTLDPAASGLNNWPEHLNIDWDLNGLIDDNDFPDATVTFGQFRGNDRIIHWREIFN